MKKHFFLICMVLIILFSNAQTGPRLVGCKVVGGASRIGTIYQYAGGDTSIGSILDFPPDTDTETWGFFSSNLTEATNGKLYGLYSIDVPSAMEFVANNLYEYDYPSNTYTLKVRLDSANTGYIPHGSLIQASNGIMYGMTTYGGTNNGGTIFSYMPGDTLVTKLTDLPKGASPYGSLIQLDNGMLYGLTLSDGINESGTIFQYDIASGAFTVLYNKPAQAYSFGSLIEVGMDTLYGLTSAGDGANAKMGTLFRYVLSTASYSILHDFDTLADPTGTLLRASDGKFYGVTNFDGADSSGTIFSYDVDSGIYKDLHDFGKGSDGRIPYNDLIQASDGMIYGMTNGGGLNGSGSLYRYNLNTGIYTYEVSLYLLSSGGSPTFEHLTEYLAPSGIVSVNSSQFNLSPNPTNGSFTIKVDYTGTLSVKVINLLGERLKTYTMTDGQQTFDISDLAAGIYEVQISNANQILQVIKIVKE